MLKTQLHQTGLVRLAPLLNPEQLERWNQLLDPIFASQTKARRYATADDLMQCGLLADLFQPSVRALIDTLIPDSRVFHLHAYEIDANNSKSHIQSDNKLYGWHRDYDCRPSGLNKAPEFISLFIYLTDVAEDGGAFEICPTPLKLMPLRLHGQHPLKVTGRAGTSFLFNRVYVHRASPNQSPVKRRVLKLSVQPAGFENDRINLPQFVKVRAALPTEDLWLRRFFGIAAKPDIDSTQSSNLASPLTVEYGTPLNLNTHSRLLHLYREFRYLKTLWLHWRRDSKNHRALLTPEN
jgi:hypothetical protein